MWWLETARRDLERAARSLREGDNAAAAFWSQQAAEKALKALHIALRGTAPKTRNIRVLIGELGLDLGLSEEELWAAYELTGFYVLARYPDIVEGVPDEVISGAAARRAADAARRVVKAAENALGEAVSRDT